MPQRETRLFEGNLIQLKNCKNGKYLRKFENGNSIDCQGGSNGKFTFFKYQVYGKNNTVKLQSIVFRKAYVAIPQNYNVKVGGDDPHCVSTFWKQ